jgi:nucleotide-binding universal stress UspA family protein
MKIRRILYATDFSEIAEVAWPHALEMGQQLGASVLLLHVIPAPAMVPETFLAAEQWAEIFAAQRREAEAKLRAVAAEAQGVKAEVLVTRGVPFLEIARVAAQRKADLIVMGTHGRTGLVHALMGSVAERVVRIAPCPVLTVRHAKMQVEAA